MLNFDRDLLSFHPQLINAALHKRAAIRKREPVVKWTVILFVASFKETFSSFKSVLVIQLQEKAVYNKDGNRDCLQLLTLQRQLLLAKFYIQIVILPVSFSINDY